ncbi:MAG TPA: CBS domain-containing protein [Methylomirabilota bacterium]|nr:CBS domain-containing protein [Methylomirabilota bacterium]
MSEFDDEYSAALAGELKEIRGALFNDTIRVLEPDQPVAVTEDATVKDAVARMMATHRAAVLIVDRDGRLAGIFTERDVLTRVVGAGLDPARTTMGQVMTRQPEALSVGDRVAFAVNRMSVAGYRTIPLVDAERRPVGIVTVAHFIKWMADLFPEAVLNLPPGDALKRPSEVDAG